MDQTQQIRVDLKDADQMVCKECQSKTFIQSFLMFRLSALLSPSGMESIVPAAVFQCTKCGTILEESMPEL